jgi:hypothetical protein
MDPVGFAASLLALTGASIRAGKLIRDIHSGYKHADRELDQAYKQLMTIRSLLIQLESFKDTIDTDEEKASCPSISTILTASQDLVTEIEAAFPINASSKHLRKRLRWALTDRDTVARLTNKLNGVLALLSTSVQLENA